VRPTRTRSSFQVGNPTETIYDRIIADAGNDKFAVTSQSLPPSYYSQIQGEVADRAVNVESPFVDYLSPNFLQMKDPKIREALKVSTDAESWITAGGGEKAYSPAESVVNPVTVGYKDNPAFSGPQSGDPAAAKKLLQEAGVQDSVPDHLHLPEHGDADKQAAALKQGWEKAGFKVTLDGLGDTYYDEINKKSNKADVVWAGWGSDWPSAITVTPPLFDGRPKRCDGPEGPDQRLGLRQLQLGRLQQARRPGAVRDLARRPDEGPAGGRRDPRQGRRLHPAGDHEVQLRPRVEGDRLREHASICDVPGPRSDRRLEVTQFQQHST
jgi:hypothetical protein